MSRFDIAIIGSGPAGISAAITAKVRNKDIILFGSGMSEKVTKAHSVLNYTGLPNVSGEALADALFKHLESLNIEITRERVTAVLSMGDYFALQTSADNIYEARTVILATGTVQGKAIEGENELLGKGVSYCATCDALFFKDKTVAVLGANSEAPHEAKFLAATCKKVYYLPLKGNADISADNLTVISGKPLAILGDGKVSALKTDRDTYSVDGVFILRDALSPEKLVSGLKTDGAHVAVDINMRTSIDGCFACGDIAGTPYQYIKAAGQGNSAALSAVAYLAKK